jgi:hypothetical protein
MNHPVVGYAVMRAIAWDGIEAGGFPMKAPPDGPQRFIPVFDTQEQAVAFASDGDRITPVKLRSTTVEVEP